MTIHSQYFTEMTFGKAELMEIMAFVVNPGFWKKLWPQPSTRVPEETFNKVLYSFTMRAVDDLLAHPVVRCLYKIFIQRGYLTEFAKTDKTVQKHSSKIQAVSELVMSKIRAHDAK